MFKVAVEAPLDDVPADVIWHMRLRLRNIAAMLLAMPTRGNVWASFSPSVLHLDIRGWRFLYRIYTSRSAVVVEGVMALPE